jgi:hypothetical protein
MDNATVEKLKSYVITCYQTRYVSSGMIQLPLQNELYEKRMSGKYSSWGIEDPTNNRIAIASYEHHRTLMDDYIDYSLKIFNNLGKELYKLKCYQIPISRVEFQNNIVRVYYKDFPHSGSDIIQEWDLNAGVIKRLSPGQHILIQKFYTTKGKNLSKSDYYHYFLLPVEVRKWLDTQGISLPKSVLRFAQHKNLLEN